MLAVALIGCKPEKPDLIKAQRTQAAEHAASAAKTGKAVNQDERLKKAEAEGTADTVVARIGDVTITVRDVLQEIARQPAYKRRQLATKEGRRALLQDMITFEVLAFEAERLGLGKQAGVQFAWKKAMVEAYLKKVFAAELSPGAITEEAVAAYYKKHAAKFKSPETRRAAFIVTRGRKAIETLRKQVVQAISEAPAKARQIFGDFVLKHSFHRPSKLLKGDLGIFDRQANPQNRRPRPPVTAVKVAFRLAKENAISAPFRAEGGWAIIQLTGIRPGKVRTLAEVRMEIRQRLLQERKAEIRRATIKALMDKAKIRIDEAKLAKLTPKKPVKKTKPKRRHPGLIQRPRLTSPRAIPRSVGPKMGSRHRLKAKEVLKKMKEKKKAGDKKGDTK